MLMHPEPPRPWNYATSAQARLSLYRARAASKRYVTDDWRGLRWEKHSTPDTPTWSPDRKKIYINKLDTLGYDMGPAHEIVSLRHTGWFADGFQQDTIRGHVVKMRTPRGTYYIPTTQSTAWDGVTLYICDAILVDKGVQDEDEHTEAAREAARDADHYAEREAEECREDWTKQEAEHEIETKRQENTEIAKTVREIKRRMEDEENCFDPYLRGILQETIDAHMEDITRNVNRMRKLKDEPWIVNNNW